MWFHCRKKKVDSKTRKKTEPFFKKPALTCWIIPGKHAILHLGGTEHSWPTLHTTWERWAIPGRTVPHVCVLSPQMSPLLMTLTGILSVILCCDGGYLWVSYFSKTLDKCFLGCFLANWRVFALVSVGFCVELVMVWSRVMFLLVDEKHSDRRAR